MDWNGHASKNPLHSSMQTSLSFDQSSNTWRPKLSRPNGLLISGLKERTLERQIKAPVTIPKVLSPWWISPHHLNIWSCRIMERGVPYTRSRDIRGTPESYLLALGSAKASIWINFPCFSPVLCTSSCRANKCVNYSPGVLISPVIWYWILHIFW